MRPTDEERQQVFEAAQGCVQAWSAQCPHVHMSDTDWNALTQAVDEVIWQSVSAFAMDLTSHLLDIMTSRASGVRH